MKTKLFNTIALSVIVGAMVSCSQELTETALVQRTVKGEEVTKLSANIGNFRSETMGEESPTTRSTNEYQLQIENLKIWLGTRFECLNSSL